MNDVSDFSRIIRIIPVSMVDIPVTTTTPVIFSFLINF